MGRNEKDEEKYRATVDRKWDRNKQRKRYT